MGSTSSTSSSNSTKQTGSFLKSSDGGKNWENKVKIDDKINIGTYNILSMAISSVNRSIIYIGTESSGLFVTKNGAENWEKINFPLTKIYGLALNKNDDQTVYATGLYNKRAKIYKTTNGGKDWTEIYTEPVADSMISGMEISKKDPNVLYVGTSSGAIYKTVDGGQSWKNIFKAKGPVTSIVFDSVNDNVLYFGISGGTVFRTMDGGGKVEDFQELNIGKLSGGKLSNLNAYSVVADPKNTGVFYIGTGGGLFRGSDFGNKWDEINILESSKSFPIRAIAINPQNTNEIIYSNSAVIYRSVDGGSTWFTFQLNTDKIVQILKYDPFNNSNIFAGLRKI